MKIKLLHDTIVRHKAGEVIEVEEAEAKRLMAFNNAVKVEAKEEKPKKKASK